MPKKPKEYVLGKVRVTPTGLNSVGNTFGKMDNGHACATKRSAGELLQHLGEVGVLIFRPDPPKRKKVSR